MKSSEAGEIDCYATSDPEKSQAERSLSHPRHLTEDEILKMLAALKRNRHGHRDWLIGLLIYRHGLRVSEACDLRWDDNQPAEAHDHHPAAQGKRRQHALSGARRTVGRRRPQRQQATRGATSRYLFLNERGQPFGRMGIARMIERAGEAAKLPFPLHVHMLRHSTGYSLANRGMDTRRLQHFLGHASITNTVKYTAMSPDPFKDIWRGKR